jgi:predicted transposase YbfD/YdcC
MPLAITDVFADLPDPRLDRNKRHHLTDILTIALCALLCGANTWEQIAAYGLAKQDWFRRFLPLANGIPSHDTFYRVFTALDPKAFAERLGRWMAAACEAAGLIPIAIDGKSARRAKRDTATGCLHLVSAWAAENGLTLGQVAVPDGSNEIAVIPELLRTLELAGALVTIDAAGCQTENARLIREGGGHYLLATKGNQPALEAAVQAVFDRACAAGFEGVRHDSHASVEDGHGRHEERYVTVIHDPVGLPAGWPDAAAVVQVGREREAGGKNTGTTQQLRRDGGRDGRLRPRALGHRERAALGARRGLPGGREPDAERLRRGEPGPGAAGGRVPAQAGRGKGKHRDQTIEGRLGRRLPPKGPARNPGDLSA